MRELARILLAASQTDVDPRVHEAVLVSERLRTCLTRFASPDGFAVLLRRALLLASAEATSLQSVGIGADGRLEGFQRLAAGQGTGVLGGEAALAITVHLLELLVTLIGESLTLRLVRQAWPDTALDGLLSRIEAH